MGTHTRPFFPNKVSITVPPVFIYYTLNHASNIKHIHAAVATSTDDTTYAALTIDPADPNCSFAIYSDKEPNQEAQVNINDRLLKTAQHLTIVTATTSPLANAFAPKKLAYVPPVNLEEDTPLKSV